ncbi:MAG: TetR/AcrR family transcriptional regulator [Holophagales bacterium]|nr:TetR/AcrR family transcriptional regulator [Holophagales bacterium]
MPITQHKTPALRGRPKAFCREEALEKALGLFWERSYNAIGVRELSERMGIGRQSLYDTFGDKHSLYLEALRLYAEKRLGMAREVLEQPGSPAANLRAFLGMWKEMLLGLDGPCGCMMVNSSTELGQSDPQVAEVLRAKMEQMEAMVTRTLAAARDAGELAIEQDPTSIARLMMVAANGLAAIGRAGVDDCLADDVTATLEHLLFGAPSVSVGAGS